MKRIALIGLGPHARRIYYPYLEDLLERDTTASFELLIDIEMNRPTIEAFLVAQKIRPQRIIYLDTNLQINPDRIDPLAAEALRACRINKAIISTEPKAHKVYLLECIKLGIQAVTDKPVTAPTNVVNSVRAAGSIYNDVLTLTKLIDKKPGSRILVQCQRRNHLGYQRVFGLLEALIRDYDVPITYISIHHSDGMWNMPDEFFYRENHPYKYGYGKLMHSGYHFIDLLIALFKISGQARGKLPDTLELFSQDSRAYDQHKVLNKNNYRQFFGSEVATKFSTYTQDKQLRGFGEVDSFSQMQLKKDGRVLTTAQLSLIQSGFSQRAWPVLPEDAYKSNGRIRHEYVNIHVGPLASIQIHSYQSKQINEQLLSPYDVGNINHFDIYVFRNSNLIGGESFEKIQYGAEDLNRNTSQRYLGHNEQARWLTLDELMHDLPSESELKSHLPTNKLLSEIYKNHARQTSGKVPFSKVNAREIL